MIFIGVLIGILICLSIYLIVIKPKLDAHIEENKTAVERNQILEDTKQQLIKEIEIFSQEKEELNKLHNELQDIEVKIAEGNSKKQELASYIEQAKYNADLIYENNLEIATQRFDSDIIVMEENFARHKDEAVKEYKDILNDQLEYFIEQTSTLNQEINETKGELQKYKAITQSAIADYKRKQESVDAFQKYKIQISEQDLLEISRLREIIPFLREKRPLCKMIWEGYYRDPASALLDRIIDTPTGIYKITNLINGKVYIGQAVNLTDRLRTHIKAGLGIDPTNNEMYKVMNQIGVENFSFEVLQYCASNELNDLEKFWIGYYKAQDFGYNMTQGGAKGDK